MNQYNKKITIFIKYIKNACPEANNRFLFELYLFEPF